MPGIRAHLGRVALKTETLTSVCFLSKESNRQKQLMQLSEENTKKELELRPLH